MVHEVAAAGFGDAADYEAARPSYPPDAVAWILDRLRAAPGTLVCDLAAGTGKLTRLLVAARTQVVAVEPVGGMREAFRTVLPSVPLLAATAERLPFTDSSMGAITIAQAFHWFDQHAAAAELARVVPPGGVVVMVWNARDRNVAWVDRVWSVMDRVEKRAPWRDHEHWRDSALPMAGFGPAATTEFRHEQALRPEDVVRRFASVSHVAVLPEVERRAVLDEVRGILRSHPATRERDIVHLPYRVDCLAFTRV